MQSYCVKERKVTESIEPQVRTAANGRRSELSICKNCGARKVRWLKKEGAAAEEDS